LAVRENIAGILATGEDGAKEKAIAVIDENLQAFTDPDTDRDYFNYQIELLFQKVSLMLEIGGKEREVAAILTALDENRLEAAQKFPFYLHLSRAYRGSGDEETAQLYLDKIKTLTGDAGE
jgi:hypothetical protein